MHEVSPERTGWRCEKISRRHREWGYNCPAVDLDFLVAEYNHGKPVALVEYKDIHARQPDLRHPTYKALIELANNYAPGPLPFLIAFYDPETWRFRITPMNAAAVAHSGHVAEQWIPEQRFVRGLYLLRKKVLSTEDEQAIARLNAP